MAEKENKVEEQKKLQIEVTINEMLATVRDIWLELDRGRGVVELECEAVAFKLCSFQAFPDHSTAQKYIWKLIQAKKDTLSWDDFNSIFSKGIFKDVVIRKAQSLNTQTSAYADAENFGQKLRRAKKNTMTNQLKEGRITSADQKVKKIRRPILEELGAIAKKSAPSGEGETIEEWFNKIQGLCDEITDDPNDVDLDAFAKHIGFKPPVQPRN